MLFACTYCRSNLLIHGRAMFWTVGGYAPFRCALCGHHITVYHQDKVAAPGSVTAVELPDLARSLQE